MKIALTIFLLCSSLYAQSVQFYAFHAYEKPAQGRLKVEPLNGAVIYRETEVLISPNDLIECRIEKGRPRVISGAEMGGIDIVLVFKPERIKEIADHLRKASSDKGLIFSLDGKWVTTIRAIGKDFTLSPLFHIGISEETYEKLKNEKMKN